MLDGVEFVGFNRELRFTDPSASFSLAPQRRPAASVGAASIGGTPHGRRLFRALASRLCRGRASQL